MRGVNETTKAPLECGLERLDQSGADFGDGGQLTSGEKVQRFALPEVRLGQRSGSVRNWSFANASRVSLVSEPGQRRGT